MNKLILCMDFDGVIHSYTSGWKGADIIPDHPVPGAIEFLHEAIQEFDVCIFSSRSGQPGGIAAMKEWLKKYSGTLWYENPGFLGLEDVRFPTDKPPAFVGIDDRVLTFTGIWPAVSELKAFKPWNKKTV